MFFGDVPTADALGDRLAHSLAGDAGRIRKGRRLDAGDVRALLAAGHERVVVARAGPDDDDEDVAAERVARALAGPGLHLSRAATGRVNLFADDAGLLVVDRDAVLRANRVDEGITLATLAENLVVAAGRLVATVKIIPFAVERSHVDAVVGRLRERDATTGIDHPLALAPRRPRTARLVQTTLPTLSTAVLDKTRRITEERLAAREIALTEETRCAHEASALARVLLDALPPVPSPAATAARPPELVLVAGASAIGDRRDVVPAALELAGGTVERFGLPVDPGNLMLIGDLRGAAVLGLPGCARSPRDNGLDRVLDRIACDVPLRSDWLDSLAIGGLLGEIVERPAPRVVAAPLDAAGSSGRSDASGRSGSPDSSRPDVPPARIGAVVLAAGSSRRAGEVNKLLYPVAGEPMIRRVVRRVLAGGVDDVVVVTGHERERVSAALGDLDVTFRHNPAHAGGMAGSLVQGVGGLAGHDAVLVCLGDMPDIATTTIERIVATWRAARRAGDERVIVVPTVDGRRGNPVLIGRVFFDLLLALEGDVGARDLVRDHPEAVREVAVEDGAILIDHDTLAALHRLDDR